MGAEIVMAVYRPHPGHEEDMAALIDKHVPLLRAEGLATDRPTVVVRAEDGTLIEIFEWDTSDSPIAAHEIPSIQAIWGAMEEIADFVTLADVPESADRFASFTPVQDSHVAEGR